MKKQSALKIMFVLLGSVLVFHFLIFFEQIPFDKVWAGRLKSTEEMKAFESFSIGLNVLILIVLLIKRSLINSNKENKFINGCIWVIVAFFSLNTIGNLFAESILELILGTTLTLTSSILCFFIVKK